MKKTIRIQDMIVQKVKKSNQKIVIPNKPMMKIFALFVAIKKDHWFLYRVVIWFLVEDALLIFPLALLADQI